MKIELYLGGPVSQEEAEQITELMRQLSPKRARVVTPEYIERVRSQQAVEIYVAREDTTGRIIGMTTLTVTTTLSKTRGVVDDVIRHDAYSRQGIGEALMRRVIDRAKELEAEVLDLTSTPKRLEAHRLYKRLGFEERDTSVYRLKL